jgi:heme oxygenase
MMTAESRAAAAPRGAMALSIKRITAPVHRRAEAAVDAAKPMESREAYARYLARLSGFYAAIEPELAERLAGVVPDIDRRTKRAAIEADLSFLGVDAAGREGPRPERLPRMDTTASALGVAYVLEGKTLGARFLLEQARASLDVDDGRGATFFAGYGVATGAMWRSFREALETFVREHGQRARVLRGAEATFDAFIAWIEPLGQR